MSLELMQLQAQDVMTAQPIAIDGQASLKEAMALMHQQRLTALPVVDNRQRPIGVLSQTDIVRYLYENPEYSLLEVEYFAEDFPEGGLTQFSLDEDQNTQVIEVMTPIIYAVGPDAPMAVVLDEMFARRVHRVFVMDLEGRLAGVISSLDILAKLRTGFQVGQ